MLATIYKLKDPSRLSSRLHKSAIHVIAQDTNRWACGYPTIYYNAKKIVPNDITRPYTLYL